MNSPAGTQGLEGRVGRFFGAGPALFATWLLLLLLAIRIQRAVQTPPIPVSPSAGKALTFLFLMGWIFGVMWALLALPPAERGKGLVTTGPFARVRHPLYAMSLFFLGLVTIASSRSWIVAAVWPLAYLEAHLWVRLEERALERAFGDEWHAYASRTPRFFPRPLRRTLRSRVSG